MNGNKLLLDTNTVLYVLSGDKTLASLLNNKELYLSIISELELLSFKKLSPKETKVITSFLEELIIVNITPEIKKITISLRKSSNLKLPDSIIAATSVALKIPLVTSDKQIGSIKHLDVVLYEK
jgi:predicted nucleic acid-binding protein